MFNYGTKSLLLHIYLIPLKLPLPAHRKTLKKHLRLFVIRFVNLWFIKCSQMKLIYIKGHFL